MKRVTLLAVAVLFAVTACGGHDKSPAVQSTDDMFAIWSTTPVDIQRQACADPAKARLYLLTVLEQRTDTKDHERPTDDVVDQFVALACDDLNAGS